MGYQIWDMAHGIWDMGYQIWAMGYRVWDIAHGISNMGYRISDMGYGISDMGYGTWDMEYYGYDGDDDNTEDGNSIAAKEKASWIRARVNPLRIHGLIEAPKRIELHPIQTSHRIVSVHYMETPTVGTSRQEKRCPLQRYLRSALCLTNYTVNF